MKLFDQTDYDLGRIKRDFMEGKLFVDSSYQRRKVWNDEDKVRLIETILMNYIVPEVFFWEADRDLETGIASTHIVDGQQRITAIIDYINDEFALTKKYLLDSTIREECGDKKFSELSPIYRDKFWSYKLTVVNIDKSCSIEMIKQMFFRLNLTEYSLNSQERRNSKDSAFGDKCSSLSSMDFWNKVKVFSSTDAKRMKDVEFCCNIYILANEFIVNQTDDKKINDYYDDYADEFDEDGTLWNKITRAMDYIGLLVDKNTISFLSKKAQLYTAFSVFIKMIENNEEMDESFVENFKTFVRVYSKFRNDYVVDLSDAIDLDVYEKIKKYKLASSEGVNKLTNRMLRYEILYNFCTCDSSYLPAIYNVERKFDEQKESVANDALDAEDLNEE